MIRDMLTQHWNYFIEPISAEDVAYVAEIATSKKPSPNPVKSIWAKRTRAKLRLIERDLRWMMHGFVALAGRW